MRLTEPLTSDEQAAIEEAERAGHPFVVLRDDGGRLHLRALAGRKSTYTVGRRAQADIALPWDREVSRLHAELKRLAGEWTIADDGLSQNGTFVNETRLIGRRRLADGDSLRVGRTTLVFRNPVEGTGGMTLLPGEMTAATALSEQQHGVVRELCRPIATDRNARPASDAGIAAALDIPEEVVATEMTALLAAFGIDDIPVDEARHELAVAVLGSGLVSFE